MKKYIKKHLKDEKRILKLMYRKGIFDMLKIELKSLGWEYLLSGKRLRKRKGKRKYSYTEYLPELHTYSTDYWGETDSRSVIFFLKEHLFWETAKEFDEIVNMQAALQEKVQPGFYNPEENIASIGKFLLANKHAMEDEMGETLDALGGIHDGIGAGAWKWWKKSNREEADWMTMKDLTERDTIELKMEIVDQFHFFMNQMIKVGMTGSELYSMYKSKNAENFNRQNRGY